MTTPTFRIPDQVMARQVGDETVILDLASGLYFGLDAVGSRVWALIGAGHPVGAICEALQGEYEVGREQLATDVDRLVAELHGRGLIEPAPPAP